MDRAATAGDPSSPASECRSARIAVLRLDSSFRSQYRTSSAPELHADEIIRRPRTGDAKIQGALAPRFLGHEVRERLPALAVDQKRGAGNDAVFIVAVSSR